MARKKQNVELDEWGNPVSSSLEVRSVQYKNASEDFESRQIEDRWDSDEIAYQKKRRREKRQRGFSSILVLFSAAVLCAAVVLGLWNWRRHSSDNENPVVRSVATTEAIQTSFFEEEEPTTPRPEKTAERPSSKPNKDSEATTSQLANTSGATLSASGKNNTPQPQQTKSQTPKPATSTPRPEPTKRPEPSNRFYSNDLRYYYWQLSDREKDLFAILYAGMMRFDQRIDIEEGGYTETELARVMYVLTDDCPELFQFVGSWSSWTMGDQYEAIEPEYRYNAKEYERRAIKIEGIIRSLRSETASVTDDFEKEFVAYRYIIQHCDYEVNGMDMSLADSALVNGKAQCSGYSRGLSLLLRAMGIPCLEVHSESLEHEWNIVRINGRWYQCDVTWDDGPADSYQRKFPEKQNAFLSHLNLPERLSGKPVPDMEQGFTWPKCDSIEDNYVYREGIYLSGGEKNPRDKITQALDSAYAAGSRQFIVMLDDQRMYQNRKDYIKSFCSRHGVVVRTTSDDSETRSFFIEVE